MAGETARIGGELVCRDAGHLIERCDEAEDLAFGFRADPPAWLEAAGVAFDANHRTRVGASALSGQTANPKLYAGGDMVRGADLVVTAVADGRDAGRAIATWLRTRP